MHIRSAVVLVSVLLAAPALAAEHPPQEETATVTDVYPIMTASASACPAGSSG